MTPQQTAGNSDMNKRRRDSQSTQSDITATEQDSRNQTATRSDETVDGIRLLPDQDVELFYRRARRKHAPADSFRIDDDMIKNNLDELLLALVANREAETNGKMLRRDLSTLFNSHLSPGTVYPSLHALEEDDLLSIHELVQTKEYNIADNESVIEQLEGAMQQHLLLGELFRQAAAQLDEQAANDDSSDRLNISSLR